MRRFLILTFLLSIFYLGFSQKRYTISGFVEDAQSGERLIGASIYETNWNKYGTFTNEYGFFSLTLPAGKIKLRVTYVGYKPLDTVIELDHDMNVTFLLQSSTVLKEVVVKGYINQVQSSQTGEIQVPLKIIENLPVIFGEADLLKSLQLMPGVASGTEGTSGVYVRGGSPDQNLILLDGVPMYNVMHLGGFFSVFTPEAIKDVTLYKSGFPARFGGRLSSVIDIRMKDGNMNKYTGSVSVGVISSKFTFEGPTVRNKGSFIISARRTYIDILLSPFVSAFGTQKEQTNTYSYESKFYPGYYFYDLYAKINHKVTPKDRIFFSLYMGKDLAYVRVRETVEDKALEYKTFSKTQGKLSWGNYIFAARWNHAFSKNLFSNLNLTYSQFFFQNRVNYFDSAYHASPFERDRNEFQLGYNLGINDLAANLDFTYAPNTWNYIRFGAQAIYHTFKPGYVDMYIYQMFQDTADFEEFKFDTTYVNNFLYAPEFGLYVEDDVNLTKWLKFNAGVRFTTFLVRQKLFKSLEPRISGRVLITDQLSVKTSFAYMTQYLHLVTNNTVGLPLDLWLPATDRILPEKSWQAAAQLAWISNNNLNFSLEVYYKKMDNVVEIKEGTSVFRISISDVEKTWEDKVSQGKGWAYGLELFVRKDFGKLTGWLGYTLAWSWRQFDSINNSQPFPYKYDRRHDLSIALNYKLKQNITLGAVFVYGSGTPVTIPIQQYPVLNTMAGGISCNELNYCNFTDVIDYYGGRNAFRLPSYQRLDFSINCRKKKKHGTRTWTFGLYNAYNHVNPFFTEISSKYDPQSGKNIPQLSVFSLFPVMPFIAYKFTWD